MHKDLREFPFFHLQQGCPDYKTQAFTVDAPYIIPELSLLEEVRTIVEMLLTLFHYLKRGVWVQSTVYILILDNFVKS